MKAGSPISGSPCPQLLVTGVSQEGAGHTTGALVFVATAQGTPFGCPVLVTRGANVHSPTVTKGEEFLTSCPQDTAQGQPTETKPRLAAREACCLPSCSLRSFS